MSRSLMQNHMMVSYFKHSYLNRNKKRNGKYSIETITYTIIKCNWIYQTIWFLESMELSTLLSIKENSGIHQKTWKKNSFLAYDINLFTFSLCKITYRSSPTLACYLPAHVNARGHLVLAICTLYTIPSRNVIKLSVFYLSNHAFFSTFLPKFLYNVKVIYMDCILIFQEVSSICTASDDLPDYRTVGISEISILHDAYVSIEVIDYAAALLQSRSYGKREVSSDFTLQISESLFPEFLRHWFLHFHTKQKWQRPWKQMTLSIQINSWFILIFLFNPQDITTKMRHLRHNLIKWGICVITYLTILRYIYLYLRSES